MKLRLKILSCSAIAVLFLISASLEATASERKVYWGGVGFSGTWQDRNSLYPATSSLLDCKEDGVCLDTLAQIKFIKENPKFDNFYLSKDTIPQKEREALVGILSINNEFFGTYQDWSTKTYFGIARIFAQFLLYEVGTGKIIQNVPFIVYANEDSETPFTEKKKFNLFKQMVLPGGLAVNIFDEAIKRVKDLDPGFDNTKYAKMNVKFSPKALDSFDATDEKNFASKFGQFFLSELVGNTDAQFIPMTIDDSRAGLKDRITVRFGDGERVLKTPEAAFNVDVLVRWAKLVDKIKGRVRTVCPAVGLTLDVSDEMGPVTNLKFSITQDSCGRTHVEQKLNMRYRFSRSLFSLLQNMSSQFGMNEPSSKWLKSNARGNDGKDIEAEIRNLNKTVFKF